MPSSRTYGVFLPDGRWGRTHSLAEAKKAVDQAGGGQIRQMSRIGAGGGAWDAPTFRISSDLVPYTPKKPRIRLTKMTKPGRRGRR